MYFKILNINSSIMRKSNRYELAHLALNNALRFGLDEDQAIIQV